MCAVELRGGKGLSWPRRAGLFVVLCGGASNATAVRVSLVVCSVTGEHKTNPCVEEATFCEHRHVLCRQWEQELSCALRVHQYAQLTTQRVKIWSLRDDAPSIVESGIQWSIAC